MAVVEAMRGETLPVNFNPCSGLPSEAKARRPRDRTQRQTAAQQVQAVVTARPRRFRMAHLFR